MRSRFEMSHMNMAVVGVTLVGTGCCKRRNLFLLISLNQLRSARITFDSHTHKKEDSGVPSSFSFLGQAVAASC